MEFNALQLFVGAMVGLFYVPCIAVVVSLTREFNLKTAMMILIGTSLTAFLAGGLAAQLGRVGGDDYRGPEPC